MADPVDNTVSDNWVDETAAPAVRVEPITAMERFVAQTLFDTQPARRSQYLKQLGFEMDAKDTNKIRPMGSSLEYTSIDPGVSESFTGKNIAEKIKNFAKETGKDVTDVVGDLVSGVIQQSVTQGTQGLAKGVTSGAGPAGQLTGQVIGGIVGGALGASAAEITKAKIGDIFLDENIPVDKKLVAVQAVIGGVAPILFQAGAKGLQKLYAATLQNTVEAVKTAVKATAGNVSDDVLNSAAKNPSAWTPAAVKGSMEKLNAEFKNFFGVDAEKTMTVRSTRAFNRDSVVGKAMRPLNEAADKEIENLATNEAANFTTDEMVTGLESKINQLTSKFALTDEDKAALGYLNDQKKYLLDKAKIVLDRRAALENPSLPKTAADLALQNKAIEPAKAKAIRAADEKLKSIIAGKEPGAVSASEAVVTPTAPKYTEDQLRGVQINFKDGRDFLKVIQDDFFNQEKLGKSTVAKFAGELRKIADVKAASVGSKLPEINAARSKALDLANRATEALKPRRVLAAYAPGGETIDKLSTRQILGEIDAFAGTQYAPQFEDLTNKAIFDAAYTSTKPMASGRVNAAALAEGLKQAKVYGATGAAIGAVAPGPGPIVLGSVGAAGGFMKGAAQGAAMANPEFALKKLGEKSLQAEVAAKAAEAPIGALGKGIAQTATQAVEQFAAPSYIPEKNQSKIDEEDWVN